MPQQYIMHSSCMAVCLLRVYIWKAKEDGDDEEGVSKYERPSNEKDIGKDSREKETD